MGQLRDRTPESWPQRTAIGTMKKSQRGATAGEGKAAREKHKARGEQGPEVAGNCMMNQTEFLTETGKMEEGGRTPRSNPTPSTDTVGAVTRSLLHQQRAH